MSNEILINVTPLETRVGLVENGKLCELYLDRNTGRGYVGSIIVGKIVRVLPGMQAAFVDIGLDKAGFIHAQDIIQLDDDGLEKRTPSNQTPDIRQLVHEGMRITVQVTKDPIATKGARLTTHLSISSRYLVYMPNSNHIGISQRIENEEERNRLRQLVAEAKADARGGFIVRTVAEGVQHREVFSDAQFLIKQWKKIEAKRVQRKPLSVGTILHSDLPLYKRALRDFIRPDTDKFRIDNGKIFEELKCFADDFFPEIADLLSLSVGPTPLFDYFNIEDDITQALKRKVPLKSGGYLIIDETEALTTVDVNTGGFVGRRNLEETIFKTNLEAAAIIARQLRLRNIGGIIILDFIDMSDSEHRRQVERAFERELEKDNVKTSISGVSGLGLIEMTRKRTRESLEQQMCSPCPMCDGRGVLKSSESVCYEILREILRDARSYDCEKLLVLASTSVIDRFVDEEAEVVVDIAELSGKEIEFRVEPYYSQEQFDIILV